MKKILLQITVVVVAMCLILSMSAMAEETTQPMDTQTATPATYTLSLEDAIKLALTDNPQIIANEHTQVGNKYSVTVASSSAKQAKKASVPVGLGSASTIEEVALKKGYYVSAAKLQQELCIKEKERIAANISYQVTNAYYNVVLMDMLVNDAKNSYTLALDNKRVIDAQNEQGYVASLTYDNADITVDAAKCELEAYELNRDIAMRTFKNQINVSHDSTVVLTDKIEIEEFTSDVEKDIKSALETRYDIFGAKKSLELSEEYLDISDAFTTSSAVYNIAYADYVTKKYQYDNALKMIDLAIRSEYNTIVTTHSSMKIAERTCNMHLSEYEAAKVQYDLGIITNLELTEKINNLYKSQITYSQAKLNYRMAVEKYKYDITIGLS